MRPLLAFWRKELLALGRDWHGLLVLFLMPAVFILIMSLALRDTIRPQGALSLPVALVQQDDSPAARELAEAVRADRAVWRARPLAEPLETVRERLRRGELRAAIVLPPGLPDRLMGGETPTVELWLDPAAQPAQRLALEARLGALLGEAQARLGFKTLRLQHPELGDALELPPAPTIGARYAAEAGRSPNAVEQSVPAYLVFAVFFVVIPMSTVLIAERQHGTLARLRAQRVGPVALLLGKLLPYVLINQAQIVLMLLLGRYIVPLAGGDTLDLDVDRGALALLGLALSLAATGWGLLVAALCRTTEQATIVGGVGNILAAALGGIMVPTFIMPAFMQILAGFSPLNWGLEGYLTVFLRQGGADAVLPYALKLAGFGLIALAAAVLCLSRSTRSR